jgi:putative NAD(P)H nitroreductase
MTVTEALQKRRAIPSFDSTTQISKLELDGLIDLASLAPSSMNLQPWELLICFSAEDKARMQSVTMNQKKVSEASAVLAVICNLDFPKNAEPVANSNVSRGYFPLERKAGFIENAESFKENPQALREEAIRSCNLWAMAFMLAATEAGWDTAPMGGFVAESLSAEFGLPATRFPVLIIAIGKRNPDLTILERSLRFPASEISHVGNW